MRRRNPGGVLVQAQRRPWLLRPVRFFGDIITELKKATWPSRRDALRLTLMVIAVSIAMGLALGAVDYVFTYLARIVLPS